jgi:capsular polysaccharide export protein
MMNKHNNLHPSSAGGTSAWPAAFRALVAHRRPLLLQGPMGGFFSDLAAMLAERGHDVTKVHFNGGDQLFWRHRGALRYNGGAEALRDWLRAVMREHETDAMVLFGQMRPLHVIAREVARELGVEVFVFEEGYLRPHYVTVERRGVNALSLQPRLASFYRESPHHIQPDAPEPTGQTFWGMAACAAAYGLATLLLKPWYSRNRHHRSLNPVTETLRWVRGGARRLTRSWLERGELERLCGGAHSKRWFLVPLQVHNDSQVRDHSRFESVEHFLEEVVASFKQHAPADALLAVKHHPMDRAYTHYAPLLRRLAREHGLVGRLRYLHDQHLPTLLHHARGVVTINSTVGLQALYHQVPVMTLGDSVYRIPGLVFEGDLAQFWQDPGVVDTPLYERFRSHLVASTQLNASFYARRPALDAARLGAPAHDAPAAPVFMQASADAS